MNVFINTCDKYNFLWAEILKNYSKCLGDEFNNVHFYINNEVQKNEAICDQYTNVTFMSDIRTPKRFPINLWSQHLNSALTLLEKNNIETILYAQDDYYVSDLNLMSKIKKNRLIFINESLDCLHMSGQTMDYASSSNRFRAYYLNTQMALWRTSSLKMLTQKNLNPWVWELLGQLLYPQHLKIKRCDQDAQIDYIALIKDGMIVPEVLKIVPEKFVELLMKNCNVYNLSKYEKLRTLRKLVSQWIG
jgi:hypothetical protein